MNLRLIGIGAGVLIILSLPLAGAIAGPDFAGQSDGKGGGLLSTFGLGHPSKGAPGESGRADSENPDTSGNTDHSAGSADSGGSGANSASGRSRTQAPAAAPARPGPAEQPRTDARCGPELSSPQGVEAQTCVLSGEGRTWGRSYYRNTSGRALDAVLTVMGPAGRTVQIRCAVGAGDEPGLCETPKEESAGVPGDYSAVAEFAVPDDEGALLLRSGSNSPVPGDG
ncbi:MULTISPECIES: hypothetical protein [unclassified Streptomyces]|uniref:hypothetical protein n=1 Tax=unclassified Streptomyces TaxID=2593676 RepID=UPI00202EB721|nr:MULTISPECIES: hypothetical protein [unclassified Streptomyces]MCM1965484.1 hypothetical protein [Streptomyces sp. G1]MCX5297328.1 hypothetical protein [Streptomyces sp. NBC_00193]